MESIHALGNGVEEIGTVIRCLVLIYVFVGIAFINRRLTVKSYVFEYFRTVENCTSSA